MTFNNHIEIDLAKYYRPTFEFGGTQPIQKEVEVELPDGSRKKIQINTKNEITFSALTACG